MEKLKLKSAWIIKWTFHGGDKDKNLAKYGLTSKVVDFLSSRYDLDKYVRPYAENLHKQKLSSLSEKFHLAHYNHRRVHERVFGISVPVFTSNAAPHYKKINECVEEDKQNTSECIELRKNFKKYPLYVHVGHNPVVEIRRVFNLELIVSNGSTELSWDEPTFDGKSIRRSQNGLDLERMRHS